jgi:hypothetical protein
MCVRGAENNYFEHAKDWKIARLAWCKLSIYSLMQIDATGRK